MDEEAKLNPNEDVNSNAAAATAAEAASPPPPSGSESAEGGLVEQLAELVDEIAAISDFRNAYRRQFCNLSRRIRLLAPMLEEAKEGPRPLSKASEAVLRQLMEALAGARELLRLGSKIFLVLKREKITQTFQDITARLEQALAGILFDELDISDEVREQVELVHVQFKRAKEQSDTSDDELFNDLMFVYN